MTAKRCDEPEVGTCLEMAYTSIYDITSPGALYNLTVLLAFVAVLVYAGRAIWQATRWHVREDRRVLIVSFVMYTFAVIYLSACSCSRVACACMCASARGRLRGLDARACGY